MIATTIGFIRSVAALFFWLITAPLAALIAFPWTLITGKVEFLYWIGMSLAYAGVRVAGAKAKLVGLENLDPNGTYIFMSNHVSNLDPPLLIPKLPGRTSVLAKKVIWRIPILGTALNLAEIVPVDRSNRDAAIQSINRASEVMKHHIHMTIFPEGTRSPNGRLMPFKKGPFHLAAETGVSIVPVTILGTFEMMPKSSSIVRSGTATLLLHPPVDPKQFESREELMQIVWNQINSGLPPERQ